MWSVSIVYVLAYNRRHKRKILTKPNNGIWRVLQWLISFVSNLRDGVKGTLYYLYFFYFIRCCNCIIRPRSCWKSLWIRLWKKCPGLRQRKSPLGASKSFCFHFENHFVDWFEVNLAWLWAESAEVDQSAEVCLSAVETKLPVHTSGK